MHSFRSSLPPSLLPPFICVPSLFAFLQFIDYPLLDCVLVIEQSGIHRCQNAPLASAYVMLRTF